LNLNSILIQMKLTISLLLQMSGIIWAERREWKNLELAMDLLNKNLN
jgi:hypothetical protein